MINKTKSNDVEFSDKVRVRYHIVMDDHRPVGVSVNILTARAKAESLARERKVGKIEGMDVYVYEDVSGPHVISIESAEKIKIKR